jgi:hypothetical protein
MRFDFDPPRFWTAIADKSEDEITQLTEHT